MKKTGKRSLTAQFLGTLAATLLPVILLLIITAYIMMGNLYQQVYDARRNEMNVMISVFDNEAESISDDVRSLVEKYSRQMLSFREDMGITKYNLWRGIKEIRQNNPRVAYGYIKLGEGVDITYDVNKNEYEEMEQVRKILQKADLTEYKNFTYNLIGEERKFFVLDVTVDKVSFGVLISVDTLIDQIKHTNQSLESIDYFSAEEPIDHAGHLVWEKSEQTGYYLVSDISDSSIHRSVPLGRRFLLVIALASLIFVPIQWILIRRYVLSPLERIKDAMAQLECDNLDYRLTTIEKTEEFDKISSGFNHMAEQIKNLKIEAYEKDIEKLSIENTNLRLQVNPHMLLNCLNMIFSLAKSKNYSCIEQISMSLSKYFHYVLYNRKDFSTIKEEMDFVSNYMGIQKVRFPGAFSFVYDVDEELFQEEIPTMLIQNFVENSIKYALKMDTEIEIIVIIRKLEDRLTISIVDTGNGMDTKVLNALKKGEVYEDVRGKHIGVWNCWNRLKLYYGEEVVFSISSEAGAGTQVWMEIPEREGSKK